MTGKTVWLDTLTEHYNISHLSGDDLHEVGGRLGMRGLSERQHYGDPPAPIYWLARGYSNINWSAFALLSQREAARLG